MAASTAATVNARSPEALVREVAAGNAAAFADLYDLLAPHAYGVIEHILSNSEASEKVLEQVFRQLWKEARQLAGRSGSVTAWVILTARTLAVTRLRGRARAAAATVPVHLGGASPWLPSPEAIRGLELRRRLLHKLVRQLPRTQAEALDRVAFGGISEAELAAESSEPLARIRAELRAAARFLRHRRQAVTGSWTIGI